MKDRKNVFVCQVLPNFWLWLTTRSPFTLTDLLSPPSLLCWGHSVHCPWHRAAWCTPCWATGSWLSPSRRCHRSGRRRVVPGRSWALLWSCRSWHRCGRSTAPSCSSMWPRTLTERCLEEIEKKTTMGTISFVCFWLKIITKYANLGWLQHFLFLLHFQIKGCWTAFQFGMIITYVESHVKESNLPFSAAQIWKWQNTTS